MVRLCTAPAEAIGRLYWIAPLAKQAERFRPPAALDPPAVLAPAVEVLQRVVRGEWNVPLFEQIYLVQLMSSAELAIWLRDLTPASDVTLMCHPHAPGSYCHGMAVGRYLSTVRPDLPVQIALQALPKPIVEALEPVSAIARHLGVEPRRLFKAAERGKLWTQRNGRHVLTTEAAARAYIESQTEPCG